MPFGVPSAITHVHSTDNEVVVKLGFEGRPDFITVSSRNGSPAQRVKR